MYWLLMMVDGDADGDGRVHSIGAGDAVAGPILCPVSQLAGWCVRCGVCWGQGGDMVSGEMEWQQQQKKKRWGSGSWM